MKKIIAGFIGVMVAGLAASYFATKGKRLYGLDTSKNLSLARVPIASSLLYASTCGDEKQASRTLNAVGMSYLGMAGGAFIDRKLGGTSEKGFNNTDIAFHLAVGTTAIVVAMLPTKDRH
jgi:hypothetical protein